MNKNNMNRITNAIIIITALTCATYLVDRFMIYKHAKLEYMEYVCSFSAEFQDTACPPL